jgi:hypothetical protein
MFWHDDGTAVPPEPFHQRLDELGLAVSVYADHLVRTKHENPYSTWKRSRTHNPDRSYAHNAVSKLLHSH